MKSVSVIIPNYNGKKLLETYLPHTIEALEYCRSVCDYEIIIIDDASTDNSVLFIQNYYPQIVLLQNEVNSGFSITINKGIYTAKKELVFLLNNDMEIPRELFDFLFPFFEKEQNVFGVFPMIKDNTGTKILESQKLPKLTNSLINYQDNFIQSKNSFSFYLCGGNALIDREKLQEINGFQTIYSPFYFEDFDLSLRAWKRGWRCYYTPETYCLHCHSATINTNFTKEKVTTIFLRNRLILNYLHTEGSRFYVFNIKNGIKYILSCLIKSNSKKKFREAYKMYRSKKNKLKKIRKEQILLQSYNLNEIIKLYFV